MTVNSGYPADCFARRTASPHCAALTKELCRDPRRRCPFYQTAEERAARDRLYGSACDAERRMQLEYWREAKRKRRT